MAGLFTLVAAPWDRARYVARVGQVVARYEALVEQRRGEGERGRLALLLHHPGAWAELEHCPPEVLTARLEGARAERARLEGGASLPAPPEADARVRILALADLTWLVLELRRLRRLSRRGAGPAAVLEAYRAELRPDPLPDPDPALVAAACAVPGPEVKRRLTALLALRHGRPDLDGFLLPRPAGAPPARVRVGRSDELVEGRAKRIEAYGRTVAVFRHEGRLYALDDACPHRGGPLGRGEIEGGAVLCPLHGWPFELETGALRTDPGVCVQTFEVEERGGVVHLLGPK